MTDTNFPIPEPAHIIDDQREATLWSVIDIKACFHNFPVVEGGSDFLGIITQDGLHVHDMMPMGLESSPRHCQRAVSEIVGRSGVKKAKSFFDDVTVPGDKGDWQALWADTLAVLQAMVDAGLMIGLAKCNFLAVEVTVLGYQLFEEGY